jgi:hypothetical protein
MAITAKNLTKLQALDCGFQTLPVVTWYMVKYSGLSVSGLNVVLVGFNNEVSM